MRAVAKANRNEPRYIKRQWSARRRVVKPATDSEEMDKSNCQAARGRSGQRAYQGVGRVTWETRYGVETQRYKGINNLVAAVTGVGETHSSEEAG
jgi:hypothetical protein